MHGFSTWLTGVSEQSTQTDLPLILTHDLTLQRRVKTQKLWKLIDWIENGSKTLIAKNVTIHFS